MARDMKLRKSATRDWRIYPQRSLYWRPIQSRLRSQSLYNIDQGEGKKLPNWYNTQKDTAKGVGLYICVSTWHWQLYLMGAIGMLQTLRVIYSSAATDSARYRRNSLYPPNEMFPFFLFSSSLCRPLPFVCVLAGHTHTKSNEVDVLAICFYLFIFFLSNKGPTLERKTKWIDILKGIQMKSKRISFFFL